MAGRGRASGRAGRHFDLAALGPRDEVVQENGRAITAGGIEARQRNRR